MKIKATKVEIDGKLFDSRREAARYRELILLQRAGEIRYLKTAHDEGKPLRFPLVINGEQLLIRSDGYPNGRRCYYTPDFEYLDVHTHELVTEDVKGGYRGKGEAFDRYRIAVFEACYRRRVRIIK